MVGISGQFRTISAIFDAPLLLLIRFQAQWFLWLLWRLQRLWHTSLYGSLSDLRTSPLFDSKSSDFCSYYGSYRGSWHTLHFTVPSLIYGPLFDLRFPLPIFEPPPTSSKTSNACITAVIAEVLAYIFRTILGTLVGAFSGCFEWCFGHDSYDAAQRERESISLCFGHDLALKRVFPYTLGTFSINECLLVLWARLVSRESVY
jgi:hypothetical protein